MSCNILARLTIAGLVLLLLQAPVMAKVIITVEQDGTGD